MLYVAEAGGWTDLHFLPSVFVEKFYMTLIGKRGDKIMVNVEAGVESAGCLITICPKRHVWPTHSMGVENRGGAEVVCVKLK